MDITEIIYNIISIAGISLFSAVFYALLYSTLIALIVIAKPIGNRPKYTGYGRLELICMDVATNNIATATPLVYIYISIIIIRFIAAFTNNNALSELILNSSVYELPSLFVIAPISMVINLIAILKLAIKVNKGVISREASYNKLRIFPMSMSSGGSSKSKGASRNTGGGGRSGGGGAGGKW